MKKIVIVSLLLFLGSFGIAGASYIAEIETNDSFANAQSVDAAFSLDPNGDIFLSESYYHASVTGTNASTSDVDYYQFTVANSGNSGFFDVDYGHNAGVDVRTTLALFDSNFYLLAFSTGERSDPGSNGDSYDSFIGTYTFADSGIYYLAVSNYGNLPNRTGYANGTVLFRPDGNPGGVITVGSVATSVNTAYGEYSSGDYTVHFSLSPSPPTSATPEPTTMILLGFGLLGVAGSARKRQWGDSELSGV